MAWREPPRIYSSVVIEQSGRFAAEVEVAPAATLAGRSPDSVFNQAMASGDITPWRASYGRLTPNLLAKALTVLLLNGESTAAGDPASILTSLEQSLYDDRQALSDEQAETFVRYLLTAPVVPFERSPLGPESLAALTSAGFATLALIADKPIVWIQAAGALVIVKVISKWGSAVGDVGEEAIRYYLPRILHLPSNHPRQRGS